MRAPSTSTRSATVLARGPRTLMSASVSPPPTWSRYPRDGTMPNVGLCPQIPVTWAGILIDPPMSVPISNAENPQATDTAGPPEEPPGERDSSHGLRVTPKSSLWVWLSPDHSGTFVLPKTIAPAAFTRATAGASAEGTWSRNSVDPPVERIPSVSNASLTVIGRP